MEIRTLQPLHYFFEPLRTGWNAEPIRGLEYINQSDEIVHEVLLKKIG